jgi:hypothetical protein
VSFEIRDGKDYLPPEDDIYGVDEIVEEQEFNSLLGMNKFSHDARIRRRNNIVIAVALVLVFVFAVIFAAPGLLDLLAQHR